MLGSKIRVSVVVAALWLSATPAGVGRPAVQSSFTRADVRGQMQEGFAKIIRSALTDPKGEFAGFLPKTGFVLRVENGRPRLVVIDNPNIAFLRKLAGVYGQADIVNKLLHICREEEPARARRLGSYTVQRVLERLEADNREPKLTEQARTNIARAVLEELVATASLDFDDQIRQTLVDYLADSKVPDEDVLGYGFSLVEYEAPNQKEWEALRRDQRLFCVRFSLQGFTVFRVNADKEDICSYRTPGWSRKISRLLADWQKRNNCTGKQWMGINSGVQ